MNKRLPEILKCPAGQGKLNLKIYAEIPEFLSRANRWISAIASSARTSYEFRLGDFGFGMLGIKK